jgi:hypothetical protein
VALTPGTRLGVYEITAQIGEGGMGQVFRARDTKLDRDVAIKILPEAFAHDAERLARFTREAKTLTSLNHPNIAAIYGLEESAGVTALVMELVEGDDLSQRIRRGAIPLDEALPIAKQIADALEAAHELNIVHRDLKPANIKVRADGTVKVLDFGLAKAMEPAGAASVSASMAATLSLQATQAGMILGTAAYMAPEQARGKTVDKRADIWAFGAVLYEMLSGHRAFGGEDIAQTLANVINKEPASEALPPTTPARIRSIVARCLVKDPRQRLRDMGDVRLALEGAFETAASSAAVAPLPARRTPVAWMAALAVAALVAAALTIPAVRYFRQTAPASPSETRVDIVTPGTDQPDSFALSPDGRQIVFVAFGDGASRLWLRPLATTTAQPLARTEGASYPFWAPDSRSVGFFANGQLKRLDLWGGTPKTLAAVIGGRGGAWHTAGFIAFAPRANTPLMRVPAAGGDPVALTALDADQTSHRWPQFLPDGRHFLFTAEGSPERTGIYLGTIGAGAPIRLTPAFSAGVFLPTASGGGGPLAKTAGWCGGGLKHWWPSGWT